MKINQKELVREIASLTGINQDKTKSIINTMRDVILKHVKEGDSVALLNLCIFKHKLNPSRQMVHPVDKKPFKSKGSVGCTITPSKEFKDELNQPTSV